MKKKIIFIIGFILGTLISGTVVYATMTYSASQIMYTKSNNQEVTLDTALNELYTSANKNILEYLSTPSYYENYGQASLTRTLTRSLSKGKYLLVISEGQAWGYTTEVYGASNVSSNISCESDNCVLTKITGRFVRVPSSQGSMVINNKTYLYYLEVKDNTDTINILQGSTTANTNKPQYLNLQVIPVN